MQVLFENEDLSKPVSSAEMTKWTQWAEEEYTKIIDFANKILDFKSNDCVTRVIFDGDKPEEAVYHGLSEEELFEKLKEANDLLEEDNSNEIWHRIEMPEIPIDEIIYIIKNIFESPRLFNEFNQREKIYINKIVDIVSRRSFSFTPSGTYSSDSREIRLYYNVYQRNNFEEFVSIFSHELFHAFHYIEAPDTFVSTRYHAKVVKEASADFFSFLYCKEKGFSGVLNNLHNKWKNDLISPSPYAKAYHYDEVFKLYSPDFYAHNWNTSIDKLKTIINVSKTNMTKAYKTLVPKEMQEEDREQFAKRRLRHRRADNSWKNVEFEVDGTRCKGVHVIREIVNYFFNNRIANTYDEIVAIIPNYTGKIPSCERDLWKTVAYAQSAGVPIKIIQKKQVISCALQTTNGWSHQTSISRIYKNGTIDSNGGRRALSAARVSDLFEFLDNVDLKEVDAGRVIAFDYYPSYLLIEYTDGEKKKLEIYDRLYHELNGPRIKPYSNIEKARDMIIKIIKAD